MWFSNNRNNFAPYAGFMLRGYRKRSALERGGEAVDEAGEDAPTRDETAGDERDDSP